MSLANFNLLKQGELQETSKLFSDLLLSARELRKLNSERRVFVCGISGPQTQSQDALLGDLGCKSIFV